MPVKKLTKITIEGLKVEKRTDYWDKVRRGLVLTVRPSGVKTFSVVYRTNDGRRLRKTIGRFPETTLKKAREDALKDLAKVQDDGNPQREKQSRRKAETFQQLADVYLVVHAEANKTPRSAKYDRQMIENHLLPRWRSRKLTDIRRGDVVDVLVYVAQVRKTPVLANRLQALISKMFNFALLREWVEFNPASNIGRPGGEENPRKRVLSKDEIKGLWETLSEDEDNQIMACLFKMILVTGQRPGEISGMRWDEIEDDIWVIPGSRRKNDQIQAVPLSRQASAILEQLMPITGGGEYVFKSPAGGHMKWLHRATERYVKATGFGFRPHDLRRTCATELGRLKVPTDIIDRILGHKDRSVRGMHYDHYDRLDEKRIALDKWSNRLEQITNGKAGKVVRIG